VIDEDAGPVVGRQGASDPPPRSWSALAAGTGCPESLSAVAQVNPGALSGAELVDAIVASEKAMSLLAARQMGCSPSSPAPDGPATSPNSSPS